MRVESEWTRQMNKKQLAESVEQEKLKKLIKPKPLYSNYYSSQKRSEWLKEKEKERRFWILGGVIIGIVAIAGIWAIIWVAT